MKRVDRDYVRSILGGDQTQVARESQISSGLVELDLLTGNLDAGELALIGGSPSSGKSCLVNTYIANVLGRCALPVAVFPVENGFTLGLMSAMSATPVSKLNANIRELSSPAVQARAKAAASVIADSMLFVEDEVGVTAGGIVERVDRLAQAHSGVGLVVVDYLQALGGTHSQGEGVSGAVQALKELAVSMKCPVIATSQLWRHTTESRQGLRPVPSDLRSNTTIADTADCLTLLYRPGLHDGGRTSSLSLEAEVFRKGVGAVGRCGLVLSPQCRSVNSGHCA